MNATPSARRRARRLRTGRVTVRRAKPSDLAAVVRLWEELLDHHHRLDRRFWQRAADGHRTFRAWMQGALSAKDRVLLVATVAGRPVGFTHGVLKNGPPPLKPRLGGFLTDMVVQPSARRRGVGRRLLQAAEAWCRRNGAQEVSLTAAVRNTNGLRFWAAMGFEPWTCTLWKSLKR